METKFFKAEITTTETWVIKRRRYSIRSWCGQCGREVSLLTAEEAARLACIETETFYELMKHNTFHIHYFHLTTQPFVCLNSLCSI